MTKAQKALNEKSKQGVSILVVKDGCVLLVRRTNPPAAGLWAPPGGKIGIGETTKQAARRELVEETGLCAKDLEFYCFRDQLVSPASNNKSDVVTHYRLSCFSCTRFAGQAVAGDDAAELIWATADDIRTLPLVPGLEAFLLEFLRA